MAKQANWVVPDSSSPITDEFTIGKQLGQPGQFGVAKLCKRKSDNKKFAVKIIDKKKFLYSKNLELLKADLKSEIGVLRTLNHENIITLHEVYESQFELYLVQELCSAGELFDEITKRGKYSEKDASVVVIQIFKGLAHMHAKGIAHCDLKPDNLLFTSSGTLKIIDFGMSKRIPKTRYLRRMCGTPYYTAPEVIVGQYHKAADCWSVGVIMFVMLYGYPPFYVDPSKYGARENEMIYKKIKKGFVAKVKAGYGRHFPSGIKSSEDVRDLIKSLLKKDVAARLTAVEAMDHKWFQNASSDNVIPEQVKFSLASFTKATRFKLTVLNLFKDVQIDENKRATLRKAFDEMDTNKNGLISWSEFKDSIEKFESLRKDDLEKVFAAADLDGDHTISFDELLLTVADHQLRNVDERIYKMFLSLDENKDGFLSAEEIKNYATQHLKDDPFVKDLGLLENMDTIIKEADINKDGKISWKEFVNAIHPIEYDDDQKDDSKEAHESHSRKGSIDDHPFGKDEVKDCN